MPTIHPVPGGTVTLRAMTELTPRAKRKIKSYSLVLAGPMQSVMAAAGAVTVDGQPAAAGAEGPTLDLTLEQADLFQDMQDALTVALLVTWTLPHPLPTTIDQLLDVDENTGQPGLYDALSAAAGKVGAAAATASGFTVDSVEDPTSPTGASGA